MDAKSKFELEMILRRLGNELEKIGEGLSRYVESHRESIDWFDPIIDANAQARVLIRHLNEFIASSLPQLLAPSEHLARIGTTTTEIAKPFHLFDRMQLCAEDLNDRYQLMLDMLFGRDIDNLESRLQKLVDNRYKRCVLVDVCGLTAPYSPSMYDEHGKFIRQPKPPAQEVKEEKEKGFFEWLLGR